MPHCAIRSERAGERLTSLCDTSRTFRFGRSSRTFEHFQRKDAFGAGESRYKTSSCDDHVRRGGDDRFFFFKPDRGAHFYVFDCSRLCVQAQRAECFE